MFDIDGRWIGFYSYGKGYSELNQQQTVPFTVIIRKGIREFVGEIFEEEEFGGIDDEITIRGLVAGDQIEFTKYYTLEHSIDDDNESYSVESDNPTIVHYKGQYYPVEQRFRGYWEIPGLREDDAGIFHVENQSGQWEMWKE